MPGAAIDINAPLTDHPLNRGLLVRQRATRLSGWRGSNFRDLRRGRRPPNDGAFVGTVKWEGGPPGTDGSLKFDGSTGYAKNTSFVNQPQGNKPVSMSAWVKFTNSASAIEIVSFFGKDGSNQAYFLYRSATGKAVSEFGSGTGSTAGTTTLAAGIWYWLCGVYNGATNSIYVNGIREGTPATYSAANFANTEHVVGAYHATTPYALFANANIDDVCIFDHALVNPSAVYLEQKQGSPDTINWLDASMYVAPPAGGIWLLAPQGVSVAPVAGNYWELATV